MIAQPVIEPVFAPPSGAPVPVTVSITDQTLDSTIHYTLDGTVPTTNSAVFTAPLTLHNYTVIRARAFAPGMTPSDTVWAHYLDPIPTPAFTYARAATNDAAGQAAVSLRVAADASTINHTIEERLPAALTPAEISGDGVWLADRHAIRWLAPPVTTSSAVTYRVAGLDGSYDFFGLVSVDGAWEFALGPTAVEVGTNSVLAIPVPPSRVVTPVASVVGLSLANNTFEDPRLADRSYVYCGQMSDAQKIQFGCAGGGNSGKGPALFSNASSWGYRDVPDGAQAISLQSDASLTQTISFPEARQYLLRWQAASRYGQVNPYVVLLDGVSVSPTHSTSSTSWEPSSATLDIVSTGDHTIAFVGLNPTGGDKSVAIDGVRLTAIGFPATVTIACPTPDTTIYYTLDGSLPTETSMLYSGPLQFTDPTVLRARAFKNGWLPSAATMRWYGSTAETASVLVSRSVDTTLPWSPLITLGATPDSNAVCVALEELLPPGLTASNLTAEGVPGSDGVVRWGPFMGTNGLTLAYQATGRAGTYPVRARWSQNGMGGETTASNLVVTAAAGDQIPVPPAVLPSPTLQPDWATNLPVEVTVACADPQARIYYTIDGTTPTEGSSLYSTPLTLTTPTILRARSFRSGHRPSAAAMGYYEQIMVDRDLTLLRSIAGSNSHEPTVSITATPSGAAACYSVTEVLPPNLTVYDIAADGLWNPTNRTLRWGPYLGGSRVLEYKVIGPSGDYALSGSGSLDGSAVAVTGPNAVTLDLSTMPQVASPVLSPAPTGVFPVTVTITCTTPGAVIHYTLNGTVPNATSPVYTGPLHLSTITEVQAIALKPWAKPSAVVVVFYGEEPCPNGVAITRTINGNGGVGPLVRVDVQPALGVRCYSITEQLSSGLDATEITGGGVFSASTRALRWGPFLDSQARTFTFRVAGPDGSYSLRGFGSFDGFPFPTAGEPTVTLDHHVYLAHSVTDNWTRHLRVTVTGTPPARTSCYLVEEFLPLGVTPLDLSHDGLWTTNIVYCDSAPMTPLTSIKWGPFLDATERTFTYEPEGAHATWLAMSRMSVDGVGHAITGDILPVIGLPAPMNVVATPGNTAIYLSWEGSGHEPGFRLYYWTRMDASDEQVVDLGLPVDGLHALTPLANDTVYSLAFTAYDSGGAESARSATVSAQPVSTGGYLAQVRFDATEYPAVTSVAVVTLLDADLNLNASATETAQVQVQSESDPDGLLLALEETGPDTGVFTSAATGRNLTFSFATTDPANAQLHVKEGDLITAACADALPPGVRVAQARFMQYDSDGDDMPDWWERMHFGGYEVVSSESDSDGDGMPDAHEYAAGTDPTQSNSVLEVQVGTVTHDVIVLEWPSVLGKHYSIEKATDLLGPFFELVTDLSGSPPFNAYVDVHPPGAGQVFYRIRCWE